MTLQLVNGVYTLCYYAGAQRIEERDSKNNPVYQYFYDAPGSDQLLFRQGGGWGRLWYQTDLMGNTTHLSAEQYDAQGHLSGGYVVEQYLYDAFGTPTVYNAAGTPLSGSQYDNRYLFKSSGGYVWYPQAGMYYCRARFYLPVHGRFLQPDPIGQAGGLNVYGYCHNDPVNGVDPSGLTTDYVYLGSVPVTYSGIDPFTGDFYDYTVLVAIYGVDPGTPSPKGGSAGGKTGGGGGGKSGGAAPSAPPPTRLVSLQEGPSATLAHFAQGGDMHSSMEVGQTVGHGAMAVASVGLGAGAAVEAAPVAFSFITNCRATITTIVATVTGYFASHPETVEEGEQEAEVLLQELEESSGAAEEAGAVEEGALATRCFPSGTQVATPQGDVNIEDIKVGDKVYACDLQTGEVQEQTVTELLRNFTYYWADVQIGAEVIRATRSHPFWVESEQQWVEAADLKKGMMVRLENGDTMAVMNVSIVDLQQPQPTYNLEVNVDHDYFVGHSHILVHNGAGSYTLTFASGRQYVGKGDLSRAADSAARIAQQTGDALVDTKWTPANGTADSFVQEEMRMRAAGGPGGNTYNQINSPGNNIAGASGCP